MGEVTAERSLLELEVYYAQKRELTVELRGRRGHQINYRHVISSLVRKSGAFQRYRYREDLFPSLVFRRAYDALAEGLPERHLLTPSTPSLAPATL